MDEKKKVGVEYRGFAPISSKQLSEFVHGVRDEESDGDGESLFDAPPRELVEG